MKFSKHLLILLFPIFVLACSQGKFASYQQGTIYPGDALEDWVIGELGMFKFTDHFGVDDLGMDIGDEYSFFRFHFKYVREGLTLTFLANDMCRAELRKELASMRTLHMQIVKSQGKFYEQYPGCRDNILDEITVQSYLSEGSTFFKGTTEEGVGLFSTFDDVVEIMGVPGMREEEIFEQASRMPRQVAIYPGLELIFSRSKNNQDEPLRVQEIKITNQKR